MRKIIFVFFLFISSCNLTKSSSSNAALKKIPTKILKEKVENNKNKFSYLMLRSQATIVNNGTTNQFNLSIRLKNQDKILISGSLLIPLFKGLLSRNDFAFYEKLNKSFYKGNYDYISDLLNFDFSLVSFQNLITGKPIVNLENQKLKQSFENKNYVLSSYDKKSKLYHMYYFEPLTFNLKKQVFTDKNKKILTIEYRDYKVIENNFLPQKVIISTKNNEKELKISLNSKIRRINEKISFPFKIPNGYKKLQL